MIIEEKDSEKLRDHLTKKFRSGNKWVAYAHPYDFAMVTCFRDIKTVHRFCESLHGKFGYVKFNPLINVLKALSGADVVAANKVDLAKVEAQVIRYPIFAYDFEKNLGQQFTDGTYNPVNWLKQVDPSTAIDKYHIVTHTSKGLYNPHSHEASIRQSCGTYREAETAFQQAINGFSSSVSLSHPNVLIIGQMKGQEFELGQDGRPKENTGIVFKRGYRLGEYSVIQVNDPGKPVDIYQPMMAKFNQLTSTIEFFNGQLEKVTPGAKIEYMNFDLLSNERVTVKSAILVSNQFKQSDPEKEGRQQNRLRPGHNL